jgi:hypothetical protein
MYVRRNVKQKIKKLKKWQNVNKKLKWRVENLTSGVNIFKQYKNVWYNEEILRISDLVFVYQNIKISSVGMTTCRRHRVTPKNQF